MWREGGEEGLLVGCFQGEVGGVGGGGEREVDAVCFERFEQERGAGERGGRGEVAGLESGLFGLEVGTWDGELGPSVEDFAGLLT